jgi:hypothetical protein
MNTDNIKNLDPINFSVEDIKNSVKPFGKSILRSGRPKSFVKVSNNDRIICKLCGGSYTRSNSYHHKKTKKHKIHEKINNKLINAIINY